MDEENIIQSEGEIEIVKDELTFDKTKNIQKLIKKESALKEIRKQIYLKNISYIFIVITTCNSYKDKIREESEKVCEEKMEIYNMIKQRIKKEERKYELIKSKLQRDRTFGDLINYVKYIFEYLWKNPYYVSKILLTADNNDIKNCLAHFFTVNFYDNNLSNNNKEGQLLFIIALLVKEEINKFNFNKPNNDIKCLNKLIS